MAISNSKHARILLPPLLAGAFAILVATSLDAVRHFEDRTGPAVGDLIAFQPKPDAVASSIRLEVERVNAEECTLDLDRLRREGGSLIVEERRLGVPRAFRVHWAGAGTDEGRTDCGRQADLLLAHQDVLALVFAAGGYGPSPAR